MTFGNPATVSGVELVAAVRGKRESGNSNCLYDVLLDKRTN
jgi:hypothetical protein